MKFNIKKLQEKGFDVTVSKDAIEIHAQPVSEKTWMEAKVRIAELVGDPGLQDYVLGSYLVALNRARILEVAD